MGILLVERMIKCHINLKLLRGNAILNFSEEYCQSRCELIESESLRVYLKGMYTISKERKQQLMNT